MRSRPLGLLAALLLLLEGSEIANLVAPYKDTDKPVVIHGVQHVFHPPATLEAWPEGDDRKSRVVFITRDIAESTIRKVFASFFEAEKKGWGQQDQQQQ